MLRLLCHGTGPRPLSTIGAGTPPRPGGLYWVKWLGRFPGGPGTEGLARSLANARKHGIGGAIRLRLNQEVVGAQRANQEGTG